jgi:ribosomal protein S18 acetylase RimI-like enzyme
MPFTIRKAKVEDAPGIAQVHVDSWRTTYRGLLEAELLASLSYERRAETWRSTLANPDSASFFYVAETENGEIVGFVAAGPGQPEETDAEAEIYAIYILENAQGQGLGRLLMQAAMGELVRRGFQSILLWVLKDNLTACRFYEAMGGKYLKEKPITIGNLTLMEAAYVWKDGTFGPGGKNLLES